MSSFKEIYAGGVEELFGRLRRGPAERAEASRDQVPQEGTLAPLVPFGLNGADVFDSTDTMDMLWYVPDAVLAVVDARIVLSFREFFAPATTVASGGGSTSGSGGSSTPTSSSQAAHRHRMFDQGGGTALGLAHRSISAWNEDTGAAIVLDMATGATFLDTRNAGGSHGHTVTIASHTHTTPAHAHDLSYGVFKETMPASWSVELRVYKWTGTAWGLVTTITGLTTNVADVDLNNYIRTSGKYRISLKSAAGQPNGGRLGCDAAGFIVGALQPR